MHSSNSSRGDAQGTPNKGVVFFHWAFKVATLFFYLFASLFSLNFIILFVLVVFLSAVRRTAEFL